MRKYQILICLIALAQHSFSFSQVEVRGRVIDAVTKKPIIFANIRFKSMPYVNGQTDSAGNFDFYLDKRTDSVMANNLGYYSRSVPVQADTSHPMVIELKPRPVKYRY
jgi:hypothetical protein